MGKGGRWPPFPDMLQESVDKVLFKPAIERIQSDIDKKFKAEAY